MLPWAVIERAVLPDGTPLVLARRGGEWEISAGRCTLMSSRRHGSEEALATLALARAPHARSVLLGGLGLGFTLRAALDHLPAAARVTVAEVAPALVAWNRTHLADVAGRPLDDPRVRVLPGDVRDAIGGSAAAWDAILLDVDNGPGPIALPSNAGLYDARGVRSCRRALRAGGVLAVWSAGADPGYLRRLKEAGFEAAALAVPARAGDRGRKRHVVFTAVAAGRK